jgi:hypothetical protein
LLEQPRCGKEALALGATAGAAEKLVKRAYGSEIDAPVDRSPPTRPGRRAADELNQ